MKGQSGIVQALGAENRMLRMKIGQIEQAQKESMFIEMLTAAAVTGLVQNPALSTDDIAEQAIDIADKIMGKVIKMSQAANEAIQADSEADGNTLAEEEPSLIIKP